MTDVTHQTVRLSKGRHASPRHGACVMELASMLAGEPFSDHPETACPVIAGFLRVYNDAIDDARRQDLYPLAAAVVGSRSTPAVEAARAKRLTEWTLAMRPRSRALEWLRGRLHVPDSLRTCTGAALPGWAVRSLGVPTEETHVAVLALMEELVAVGSPAKEAGAFGSGPADGTHTGAAREGEPLLAAP